MFGLDFVWLLNSHTPTLGSFTSPPRVLNTTLSSTRSSESDNNRKSKQATGACGRVFTSPTSRESRCSGLGLNQGKEKANENIRLGWPLFELCLFDLLRKIFFFETRDTISLLFLHLIGEVLLPLIRLFFFGK